MKNPFIIIFVVIIAICAIKQILSITIQVLSFQNIAVSLLVIFGILFTMKVTKQ